MEIPRGRTFQTEIKNKCPEAEECWRNKKAKDARAVSQAERGRR